MEELYAIIAGDLAIKPAQVRNTINLLDEENTVPFIARYRKEMTGSIDEDIIRQIQEKIKYLRNLEARRTFILNTIKEQGKLTPELEKKVSEAENLQLLEDLYLPYKQKKRTRATVARERGLEDLAETILNGQINSDNSEEVASRFINEEKGLSTSEEAIQGAQDIIAETISDNAEIRRDLRQVLNKNAEIETKLSAADDVESEFQMYAEFSEPVAKIPPHRILAINRGEKLKKLKVRFAIDEQQQHNILKRYYGKTDSEYANNLILAAGADALKRLILPSIEREIRRALTESADSHAISVFVTNLRQLLLQPPLENKRILGIDPGFKSGSKIAAIDETGRYLEGETIYPHPPQSRVFEAKNSLCEFIDRHNIDVIAIGNGTASRETEQLVADLIKDMKSEKPHLSYIIVNEAGASVYSASPVAKVEFPDLEASMRGNISIARRLLDPMAELVKIDPKHLGVGLYQHDVDQKALAEALDIVVESAVNSVGVDLNTASPSLLRHVSGLTARTAQNIVTYKDENGPYVDRNQLKKVSGVGDLAFQQAAGFLRIRNGDSQLDNTSIHPESYEATQKILAQLKIDNINDDSTQLREKLQSIDTESLAREMEIGLPTLNDIIEDLKRPGRDPRKEQDTPILKSDIVSIEDLTIGMSLQGTVRNVVDFGAFVDVGLKNDGLVHISQLADRFVKKPSEVVSVGQVVTVRVLNIDLNRGRVGLSMKSEKKRN